MVKVEVNIYKNNDKNKHCKYIGHTKIENHNLYSQGNTIEECKHNMVNVYEDAAMEDFEYKELDDEIHFIFSYNEELP